MNPIETIVIVTGGFDPVHSGHIKYIRAAKELGNYLVVGLNSDEWLTRKKGRPFMSWNERHDVLDALSDVDWVIDFDDSDGSARDAIRKVKERFPAHTIIFANGGDRTSYNIPEMTEKDVIFKFGIGGDDKANSSSWILEEWKSPKTDRLWGYYRVLHTCGQHVKLKELTVNPKSCLSMQRHNQRAEFWFVAEGEATVYGLDTATTDVEITCQLKMHESSFISTDQWHQLCNETDQPLKLIEIQFGENCVEEDIERK